MTDVWKLLDGCRIDSGANGTNVAFGYEALRDAVHSVIARARAEALEEAANECERAAVLLRPSQANQDVRYLDGRVDALEEAAHRIRVLKEKP